MFKKIRRWFKKPSNPSGNIYYVKLSTPSGIFYKLGYTTKSTLIERFSYNNLGDEKLIKDQLLFVFRQNAWDIEQEFLDYFDSHRAFGKYSNDPLKPLAGRGQSELFQKDILGLDENLYSNLERLNEKEMVSTDTGMGGGCFLVLVGLALAPFTAGISLLLILGGISDVVSFSHNLMPAAERPVHPRNIQKIINGLKNKNN